MGQDLLKSYQFRQERENSWRELEAIIAKAEKGGIKKLSAEEAIRLPSLYRAALSSLSVARNVSLDQNLLSYLENLTTRAFFQVYGAHSSFSSKFVQFFTQSFPRAVRENAIYVLLSFLFMALGTVVGFALVQASPDWFYAFVDPGLAGGRNPDASVEYLRDGLFPQEVDSGEVLQTFASFLFSHNARIGMLCFALGFALGIPTALLLVKNGLMLGAFLSLFHSKGLLFELGGWLLIHGVTELLAIILCGAAGFMLAGVFLSRKRQKKLSRFGEIGRVAGRIVIGAVFLFFLAAILEGFFRQLITDTSIRYAIAVGSIFLWSVYFSRTARKPMKGSYTDPGRHS